MSTARLEEDCLRVVILLFVVSSRMRLHIGIWLYILLEFHHFCVQNILFCGSFPAQYSRGAAIGAERSGGTRVAEASTQAVDKVGVACGHIPYGFCHNSGDNKCGTTHYGTQGEDMSQRF